MIKYHLLLTREVVMTQEQDGIFIIMCGIWPHNSQGLSCEIKWMKMLVPAL